LVALKEAGAINIIDLPGMLGFVHFRVEVAKDVDESQLTASGASTRCVKSIVTRPTITVLKVDMVKGGRTQWDGAIVYYTVTNTQFTELFRKYVIASKRDWVLGGTRVRELWKYDIFNKTWKRNPVTDGGPLNGEFMTSRVPEALERD
jgi:hypothetical protein